MSVDIILGSLAIISVIIYECSNPNCNFDPSKMKEFAKAIMHLLNSSYLSCQQYGIKGGITMTECSQLEYMLKCLNIPTQYERNL